MDIQHKFIRIGNTFGYLPELCHPVLAAEKLFVLFHPWPQGDGFYPRLLHNYGYGVCPENFAAEFQTGQRVVYSLGFRERVIHQKIAVGKVVEDDFFAIKAVFRLHCNLFHPFNLNFVKKGCKFSVPVHPEHNPAGVIFTFRCRKELRKLCINVLCHFKPQNLSYLFQQIPKFCVVDFHSVVQVDIYHTVGQMVELFLKFLHFQVLIPEFRQLLCGPNAFRGGQ